MDRYEIHLRVLNQRCQHLAILVEIVHFCEDLCIFVHKCFEQKCSNIEYAFYFCCVFSVSLIMCLRLLHIHDKWVPVTTAWRVLRLWME